MELHACQRQMVDAFSSEKALSVVIAPRRFGKTVAGAHWCAAARAAGNDIIALQPNARAAQMFENLSGVPTYSSCDMPASLEGKTIFVDEASNLREHVWVERLLHAIRRGGNRVVAVNPVLDGLDDIDAVVTRIAAS